MNWLEFALLVPAVALACWRPRFAASWWRRIETRFWDFARRRTASIVSVAALAILLRLAILPFEAIPQPGITDEFSHLLLADTLAHGRMANPTHPMWRHFETIHVIQRPTYSSMYFPGQGLFLALGETLTHCPWIGVLLSMALLCGAVCWALQGWLPPAWALGGGLLCALRFGLFSYWIDGYWGGAVPALGGALVLGACPRIRRCPDARSGLPAGVGLALLAVSRPFDGIVLCVPLIAALVIWLAESHGLKPVPPGIVVSPELGSTGFSPWKPALPILLICGLTVGFLCLYQFRVTGDALRPAYAVNQQTYGWPLTLPWFPVRAIALPNRQMSDYYSWEQSERQAVLHPFRYALRNATDAMHVWSFYFGPLLSVPLLFLPWILRDRRMRLPLAVTGWMLLVLALEDSRYPHYLSSVLVALLLLSLEGYRHLRAAGRRSPAWLALARLLPALILAVLAARLFIPPLRAANPMNPFVSWCCSQKGNLDRAAVLADLDGLPGRHLVFVTYRPEHVFTYEWVYNEADIDAAKVVWARDLGSQENRRLIDYFGDRQVWTVDADRHPARPIRIR